MLEILPYIIVGLITATIIMIFVLFVTRERFDLDLIDLEDYTASVLIQVDRGITPMPPPTIPGGSWTLEERHVMEKNRIVAREIYNYAKGKLDN